LECYFKSLTIYKEILNGKHILIADSYNNIGLIYLNKTKYDKSLEYLFKSMEIYKELLGDKHTALTKPYNNIGRVYSSKYKYDKALEYFFKSLDIQKELLLVKNKDLAYTYGNIGAIYHNKSEYDKSLKYYLKCLEITKKLFGEKHAYVAYYYNQIGYVFKNKSEYDKALECFFKSLKIRKELFGEKHIVVSQSYNNIGIIYWVKTEYNRALEYFFKCVEITKELYGEKHLDIASFYNNIGLVYTNKSEYDKALEYHLKSLEIKKELFGENHINMANSYNNIGNVYYGKSEYNKALEYYFKSLKIYKELFGVKHREVATNYINIGNIYQDKSEYDTALEYYQKSLEISIELLGEKHTIVASTYNHIGNVYYKKSEYNHAIKYYQLGTAAVLRNFNDTVNITTVPFINDYLSWGWILTNLQAKAKIFADSSINMSVYALSDRMKIALRHYQACDTLISQVRQEMKTKSDKIALGEKASEVYKGAVNVCLDLAKDPAGFKNPQGLYEQALYFSEKNKSSVLLESLAGAEAQKFAGIPDTLLKQEHNLQINIALYKKILAEGADSLKETRFKDKLFKANRSYDSLIVVFENNYPKYFELKYNQKPATVNQISKLLDKKTAIISYFTSDSAIAIFTIKKKKLYVTSVVKPADFEEKIELLRYNISNPSVFMSEINTGAHKSVDEYQKTAFELYQILFPQEIIGAIGKKTENLIIIPDGRLATLPFEALQYAFHQTILFLFSNFYTKNYTATWTGWQNKAYFPGMPYLLKDYNISYNYSANLFYKTFNKSDKQKDIEITNLNDWLAFAPVFDDKNISGTSMRTRKLLEKVTKTASDSVITRAFSRDGMYISELPGSLDETKAIFNLYAGQDKKALLKTHLLANEEFIKSGELSKYKYLHFATHGMVNEAKPELSGLILAQDTTSKEDNILFSGEIYNMKLNAELSVLSACETGLGKISKGEGVIGLTRALLYAGSKNIIVSLWPVADNSTKELMVNFYENLLNSKKQKKFAKHLKHAKLKLINDGKYAHPFFWSPFILIGE